ncbi:amidohydrolase, partial [bacterium]|nr:amidohydrolase [bacterium]
MKIKVISLVIVCSLFITLSFANEALKKSAVANIEKHATEMTALSDQIWEYAELALRETKSSKALADYAEQQGFKVT